MGDEDDRFAVAAELVDLVETLGHKRGVADRQYLVDEQDVGADVDGDGKPQTHIHAGRVALDRMVDKLLELGEIDDFFVFVLNLLSRKSKDDAVDEDVFPARYFGMEARSQLDEGRNPALGDDLAVRRFGDSGQDFQKRALP